MPYISPLNFSHRQIEVIKNLMKEFGFKSINDLARRALSVFNSLAKVSSGTDKKIYLIEAHPDEIKLSHNGMHYILDASKVKVLVVPLLHKYKK